MNIAITIAAVVVVLAIGTVIFAELYTRHNRSPKKAPRKEGKKEVRFIKMYNEADKKFYGKGVPCTEEEAMEYINRWHEADSTLDLGAYILYSHIPNNRPVWVN